MKPGQEKKENRELLVDRSFYHYSSNSHKGVNLRLVEVVDFFVTAGGFEPPTPVLFTCYI